MKISLTLAVATCSRFVGQPGSDIPRWGIPLVASDGTGKSAHLKVATDIFTEAPCSGNYKIKPSKNPSMNGRDELLTWTRHFLEARNAILKDVMRTEEDLDGYDIIVTTNTKQQGYLILPDLGGIERRLEGLHGNTYIVTLNTRKNLTHTINAWTILAKSTSLCLLFVNPAARGDQKWAVFPSTHAALTDPKKLQTGLKALFSGVEEVR